MEEPAFTSLFDAVSACAKDLASHNGQDSIVMDLTEVSGWTDYFIISTATSSTHLKALARHVDEFLKPKGYSPVRNTKIADDEQWCLLDYGNFVVHLMSSSARAFYDLENLWHGAKISKFDNAE